MLLPEQGCERHVISLREADELAGYCRRLSAAAGVPGGVSYVGGGGGCCRGKASQPGALVAAFAGVRPQYVRVVAEAFVRIVAELPGGIFCVARG